MSGEWPEQPPNEMRKENVEQTRYNRPMKLQDVHVRSLGTSSQLSSFQAEYAISPTEVISVLSEAGVRFVLVGAYGLAGWVKEPRGTKDVDVVVAAKHLKKAIRSLQEAFPHLQVEDDEVVLRFRDPESGEVVIDVMKPRALYRDIFKHTHTVETDRQRYRIPSLEMALTMKFAAMKSPHRADADKHQDAHDFILMVKGNHHIDLETLSELGELVYGGGGEAVLGLVKNVRADEKLIL